MLKIVLNFLSMPLEQVKGEILMLAATSLENITELYSIEVHKNAFLAVELHCYSNEIAYRRSEFVNRLVHICAHAGALPTAQFKKYSEKQWRFKCLHLLAVVDV